MAKRRIVAYGTLRKGSYSYTRYEKGLKTILTNIKFPGMQMYSLGPYPACILSGSSKDIITVDVHEVDEKTFLMIDGMEKSAGYSSMSYNIPGVGACTLYTFLYKEEQMIDKGFTRIVSGDWLNRETDKKYTRNIYIVNQHGYSNSGYINWMEGTRVNNMEDADLVCFTGGEDVDPALYDDVEGYKTYFNKQRDDFELQEYEKAKALGKPMIGICRGSQLLCVLNGGKLIQHMNHPGGHNITTNDGQVIEATSTHHQMQYPFNLPEKEYELLAWANELSNCHLDGHNQEIKFPSFAFHDNRIKEPEIVFYPKNKCLAIQMHPEYFDPSLPSVTLTYLRNLINTKLLNTEIKENNVKLLEA
jgi:gamma-glutamyl-gamma-aminobutyrate hydrolase PuuD/gamma-glutamylcyclotransferase (GGCT)/AIG2-like uncharacterized protein YtfP